MASSSVTAVDVGPRILAQCANSQSHWDRNGAHTELPKSSRVASYTEGSLCIPGIGAPGRPKGKRSTMTPDLDEWLVSELAVAPLSGGRAEL
jgi:hypothetical protein